MRDVKIDMPDAEYYSRDDMESLMRVVKEVEDTPVVALDTETTGLNRTEDIVLFWSLSWGLPEQNNRICMRSDTLPLFRDAFADPDKSWVFANAKYDVHLLANMGCKLAGNLVDTQVMHALLYEDMPHRLKFMMQHLFGWTWRDFNDVFPRQKGEGVGEALLRGWEQDRDLLIEYAANDAYGTLAAYWELEKRLEEAPTIKMLDMADTSANLLDLFWEIEVPYTKVLWKCERHGAKIDTERLDAIRVPMEEGLAQLRRDIMRATDGIVVNPNSNDQWKKYLFTAKKYPVLKQTKGGKKGIKAPSVDEDVRTRLLEQFGDEALKYANEHAKLAKLYGTYVMGLHKRLTKKGYVHTSFNQHIARTGRLSSSDPNMQNWPRADEDEYKMRDALICEPGHKLLVYDYAQLEMRILADMAKEQSMIDMIISGRDIHMGNASIVFDVPYDDIVTAKKMKPEQWEALSKEQIDYYSQCLFYRQAAKAIGFGLNYGMKENNLAVRLNITKEEAREKMDQYLEAYPAVRSFFESAVEMARDTGFAFTYLGRRRRLVDITSSSPMMRWRAERVASNLPIQGGAADIVKRAMILIDQAGLDKQYGYQMFHQVHDEIIGTCPEESVEAVCPILKQIMEHPLPRELAVPLPIDGGVGNSWAEAK